MNLGEIVHIDRLGDEKPWNLGQLVDLGRLRELRPLAPAPRAPLGRITHRRADLEVDERQQTAALSDRVRAVLAAAPAAISALEVCEVLGDIALRRVQTTLAQLTTHGDAASSGQYGSTVYALTVQGRGKVRP